MKKKPFLLLIAILAVVVAGFRASDGNFIELINEKLREFNRRYREEKVYLHLDKTLYKPGDNIWFKAYVLDASTLLPTPLSSVLYVELIDPRGSVVRHSEWFVEDGVAHGDFMLDSSAPGGNYSIRAHTQWMQNFGEERYFLKDVLVQTLITPRLLLKLDFEKKAYGNGDWIVATLKARNLKDEPIQRAGVKAQLRLAGIEHAIANFTTDLKGEVSITFQLPDSLKTADGLLQALVSTSGMEESISRSVPIVLNTIHLRFFPEGGDIVAGAGGRVAFQALNSFGKGADISGIVEDELGNQAGSFESFHFGMGAFTIHAQTGHRYSARITKPSGIREVYYLPVVKPSGLALSVIAKSDTSLAVRVYSESKTEAYLIARCGNRIHFARKVTVEGGWNVTDVPTAAMPAGICVITLFNADGVETAERLYFVNHAKTLHIELTTAKQEYVPGGLVELSVKTADVSGHPVAANLSVAVVDDQLLTAVDDKQDNILSSLLLSSELKGKIEEPSFFFDERQPKSRQAIDYLLMVHGWRRFTWKEVLAGSRPIVFLPENIKDVGGIVVDKQGLGTQADVFMIELSNRKRIAKVKTRDNGQFLFRNIDSSTPIVLLTRNPNSIQVNGNRSNSLSVIGGDKNDFEYLTQVVDPGADPSDKRVSLVEERPSAIISGALDVNMGEDVSQLSEVIVTGLGFSEQLRATGASTVSIRHDPGRLSGSAEQMVAGRVSGLVITESLQPVSGNNLRIRGVSSLGNRSQPLWVIDGVPASPNINPNLMSALSVDPAAIQSIHVIKGIEGLALYGSAAANGVIVVETKTGLGRTTFRFERKKSKYSAWELKARTFSVAREFYSDSPTRKGDVRKNFEPVVLWKHTVTTNKEGKGKVSFLTNDAVSNFRIVAEGISNNGLIGRAETTIHTLLPFSVDAKLPGFLGYEDTVRISARITNNTGSNLSADLTLDVPAGLRSLNSMEQRVEIMANQTLAVPISLVASGMAGDYPILIRVDAAGRKDEIRGTIRVHSVGFPVHFSYAAKDLKQTLAPPITNMEKGSLRGEILFVDDILDELFTGAEAMLDEPHGCFEQVSSSTFPNILALQLLRQTGKSRPDIEKKALAYIERGYAMLTAYEIGGGGFEWFGHAPAHEALTAFGLIEFVEMKKVYPGVNDRMIERTRRWLLDRRKGDGTFDQASGKYGFSAAPQQVNNAYMVYALTETGAADIDREYRHSLEEAKRTKDMYRSALMAHAAINQGKLDDYKFLIDNFTEEVRLHGLEKLKAECSLTYSYGRSLSNEMVSLWALALMKSSNPDYKLITEAVDYIGSKKSNGMYGSTQATYLSLKAIAEYGKLVKRRIGGGEITVRIGDSTRNKSYTAESTGNISFSELLSGLTEGNNKIEWNFGKTTDPLPCALDLTWFTKLPQSCNDCGVRIETQLTRNEIKLNETVRYNLTVTNTRKRGQPMTMAVVGIPGGLSLQPWQLKELKEKKAFDFYEVIGDKLALYFVELGPAEVKKINLDLKADVSGVFVSSASCSYLYYTDEAKHWVPGVRVTVQ